MGYRLGPHGVAVVHRFRGRADAILAGVEVNLAALAERFKAPAGARVEHGMLGPTGRPGVAFWSLQSIWLDGPDWARVSTVLHPCYPPKEP